MIIHCTRKLIQKFPGNLPDTTGAIHPLGEWHANLHIVDRRQCVLFCHDKTRFALFSVGLKRKDFQNLGYIFVDLFVNTLLKLQYSPALIEYAANFTNRTAIAYDSSCNRSVLGSMRSVFQQDIYGALMNVSNVMDLPYYSTSARLNNRPTRTKGMKASDYLWPADEMRSLLKTLAAGSGARTLH